MRSAGCVIGVAHRIFFLRRMGGEPRLLLSDHLGGLFAEIADGLERQPALDVVGVVVRRRLDGGGPAFKSIDEFRKRLADVAVAGTVVVEVVIELVCEGSELLEEIVGVLLAAGTAGFRVEILQGLDADVDELDEDHDTVIGDVSGVAEFFDLFFGESGFSALCAEWQRESQEGEEKEGAAHGGDFSWPRYGFSD